MSLEDVLREKVATREAEQLREEQEQKVAIIEVERLQKQETEELHLADLRKSIKEIDAKAEKMRLLLDDLEKTHEQAHVSVSGAKKEGRALVKATAEVEKLFANDTFRALLAEEGIHSFGDLLRAEEYSGQEEIKMVKELEESHIEKKKSARKEIGTRRQTKVAAREAIVAEKPNDPQKLTYRDITGALEGILQELGDERKKRYYQTPEGQEALRAEILERVGQRRQQLYFSELVSREEINKIRPVKEGDFKDIEIYGEEKVKSAIKEYYDKFVDEEISKEKKRSGQSQLQEAVETIENLPKRWHEIRSELKELQQEKEKTIGRLAELLGDDPKKPLFREVSNYFREHYSGARELAEAFIDAKGKNNSIRLGIGLGAGEVTPETFLEKTISNEEQSLEKIYRGNSEDVFPKISSDEGTRTHVHMTRLNNPERMVIILAEQAGFYRRFQEILTTPEELLDKIKEERNGLLGAAEIKSKYDLGFSHNNSTSQLSFDYKTYSTLCSTPFSEIKAGLKKQRKELEKTAASLKEQFCDEIEMDWASGKFSKFEYDQRKDIKDAEKVLWMQKLSKELLPSLHVLTLELEGQVGEQLSTNQRGRLYFDSTPETNLQSLRTEAYEARQKLQKIEEDLLLINRRATSEGDGFLGGKRKQREKETATIEEQKQGLQERLQELERDPQIILDKKMEMVRLWLSTAKERGLELKLPGETVSLNVFFDDIKKQMNVKLDQEQSHIYEQYEALKKEQEQTKKQYEKWKMNS